MTVVPAPAPLARELTEAYEQLRHEAVAASACSRGLHGLAILMRAGMATWMQACLAVAPAGALPAPVGVQGGDGHIPAGVEREVIYIVTAMAMAAAEVEVRG